MLGGVKDHRANLIAGVNLMGQTWNKASSESTE